MKHTQRRSAVLNLALLVLTADHDSSRDVRDSHSRIGRVHRLTAGAARAEHIHSHVIFRNFDGLGLFHQRHNLYRRKTRLTLAGRVERTHAHESVGAGFNAQRAERIRRVHLNRGGLDSCLFGVACVKNADRVPVLLGPAQVHAQQHFGEVGSIDPTRARANGDDSGSCVVLTVQQRLHFQLIHHALNAEKFDLRLGRDRFVASFVCHLNEHLEIIEAAFNAVDFGELRLGVTQAAGDLLRVFHVVPQIWNSGRFAEFGDVRSETIKSDDGLDVGERRAQRANLVRQVKVHHDASSLRRRLEPHDADRIPLPIARRHRADLSANAVVLCR